MTRKIRDVVKNVLTLVGLTSVVAGGTTVATLLLNRIDGGLSDAAENWRTWVALALYVMVAAIGYVEFKSLTRFLKGSTRLPGPVELIAPPPLLTRAFTGRKDDLAWLHATVGGRHPRVAVVHGLGGMGKSSLVVKYLRDRHREGRPEWWITADSTTAIRDNLAQCARALNLGDADAEPALLAHAALSWLVDQRDYLLVLDNAQRTADIKNVLQRMGSWRAARVIVTTRLASGWVDVGESRKLGVLEPDQAVKVLTARAGPKHERSFAGAIELVAELGYLPLAVDQVGAYLGEVPDASPQGFLEELRTRPETAIDRAAFESDSARTISWVWRVTLERLAAVHPGALDVLRVLAWWSPDRTPASLLKDVPGADSALQALAGLSMITRDADVIQIHALVQLVARVPDDEDPHRQPVDVGAARERAARLLVAAIPGHPEDPAAWQQWREIFPCVESFATATSPQDDTPVVAHLLDWAARFIQLQGNVSLSLAWLERNMETYERLLGADAPDTLRLRNNVADTYRMAGNPHRAVVLLVKTLADSERVLGVSAEGTRAIRNNLAMAYVSAGDPDRAIPLCEQTLADCERSLGRDSPEALMSRNNLADAFEAGGHLDRAISLYEQTLADRERVLGIDARNTLTSRHNLAAAYMTKGDLDRAIPLFEQALAAYERVLGPDSPDTLNSRGSLAVAYEIAGEPNRAIPLFERTLEDRERVLGMNARETLRSRINLATAYELVGEFNSAASLLEQALEGYERLLVDDHPLTQTVRKKLQSVRQAAEG